MSQARETDEDQKAKIVARIGALSRLLTMEPSNGTIKIHEPLTQNEMVLSDWFDVARKSFFELSVTISRELDVQLQ